MRGLSFAVAVFSMIASPALAAPCKDAKGKFIKCPVPAATPVVAKTVTKTKVSDGGAKAKTVTKTTVRCRNAKGQFAKCGTPGAKPV